MYTPSPFSRLDIRTAMCTYMQLCLKHQSVGGLSESAPPSMATTVLMNVKKGLSALSEFVGVVS